MRSNHTNPDKEKFLDEFYDQIEDPVHKRLIKAHSTEDPLQSMEKELGVILVEVLKNEN